MGMDVYGRSPACDAGKYFRASIFQWPNFLTFMQAAGVEVPIGWSANDGKGPSKQTECNEIADKLEALLASPDVTIHENSYVIKTGIQGEAAEKTKAFGDSVLSSIMKSIGGTDDKVVVNAGEGIFEGVVSINHMKEWIVFLRACGGFEIL